MTGRPALNREGLPVGYSFRPDLELTPRHVKRALDAGDANLVLIDCRTKGEWATARIKGAVLIPLDELGAKLAQVEDLIESDQTIVAVHCHHGVRSIRAALFLRQHGINAMSMAGGIDLWSMDIDPSVPRY